MNLTESINDIIEQAAGLLSPPDMSDWTPPDAPAEVQAQLEQDEHDRRVCARLDAYLADRSDRLACLKAIRDAAMARADAYKAQAKPWLSRAADQERLRQYVETLARNVLEAERQAAGFESTEPYTVELPSGQKIGLRLSPWSIKIANVEDLPGKFVQVEKVALKDEIKRALEAGQVVPGASRVRGDHIHWGR